MGCDIHLYVETKQEDGSWKALYEVQPDSGLLRLSSDFYDGRNYDLFAILANVRNGIGFAGIKSGEGFNPISMPKGLPEDMSAEVKKYADDWEDDGHSHSWFTLAELLVYDWNQTTINYGIVDYAEYKKWKQSGEVCPDGWCGMVQGQNVVIIHQETADRPDYTPIDESHTYVNAKWGITYKEASRYFVETTLPRLQALGKPDDVRIVFWFNN